MGFIQRNSTVNTGGVRVHLACVEKLQWSLVKAGERVFQWGVSVLVSTSASANIAK